MAGKLIVIEGIDGSGKRTQSELLEKHLNSVGQRAELVSFPRYEEQSSALVKMYLAGEFGAGPLDVGPYAASAFYAVDRYASYKSYWGGMYNSGAIIIADRYTTSNAVHQTCKLPRDEWDEYLHWLYDTEYNKMGIPAPDLVIFLSMPASISRELMDGRVRQQDIHEADQEFMQASRNSALYAAQHSGWSIIECAENGKLLTREEIHKKIAAEVDKIL